MQETESERDGTFSLERVTVKRADSNDRKEHCEIGKYLPLVFWLWWPISKGDTPTTATFFPQGYSHPLNAVTCSPMTSEAEL